MAIEKVKKRNKAPALTDEIFLHEDLLREILLRVPAKSLIRFKGVCKSWLNLISDSNFCYNHSAQSRKEISRILYRCCPKVMSVSLHGRPSPNLPIPERVARADLEHSCNGLILFSWDAREHYWSGYSWNIKHKQYGVCNLTTQKSTIVPLPDSPCKYYMFSCLAFDPAKSPFYKIVLIKNPTNSGLYQIDIFLSETKSWRHLELSAISWHYYPQNIKAYWDGSIHWINFNDSHFEFNVDKEKLIETPLPKKPTIRIAPETLFFGECNGNLLLVQYKKRVVLGFKILQMKRGTRHWVVKMVNLRPILDEYPDPCNYKFHVMSVVEGSGRNELIVVVASGSKFLSYNLRTKAVVVLGDRTSRKRFENCTHQFFESLSPI